MFNRCKNLFLGGLCLIMPMGCGHRQNTAIDSPISAASQAPTPTTQSVPQTLMVLPPVAVRTFQSKPPAIQFDYPADWLSDKANTACFCISAPKSVCPGNASMCLDIPKLPWHMAGLLSVNMVASGYISDLKKNQIHDAIVKEQDPVTVAGCTGQRITCTGHTNGNPATDIAIILIHADQVFILSADCDDAGYDTAKKTIDSAVASLKWNK